MLFDEQEAEDVKVEKYRRHHHQHCVIYCVNAPSSSSSDFYFTDICAVKMGLLLTSIILWQR